MAIIIQILIYLGLLAGTDAYTEDYRRAHQHDIDYATTIYNNGDYTLNGGIVIDVEVSPTQ